MMQLPSVTILTDRYLSRIAVLFWFSCLFCLIAFGPHISFADDQLYVTSQRISEEILANRKTWEPFLTVYTIGALRPYSSAATLAVTPETIGQWKIAKPELERIANEKGNERAADALLVLACAEWCFNKDKETAIGMARSLIRHYSEAASILEIVHDPNCPIRMNLDWQFYVTEQIENKNRQGSRTAESKREKAIRSAREAYIMHMIRHPVLTADVATLFIYSILGKECLTEEGEQILKGVMQRHPYTEMKKMKEIDQEVAAGHCGIYLRRHMRPEITAAYYLISHYQSLRDTENAKLTGQSLADAISEDGFYWQINEILGDLYLSYSHDLPSLDAERQYRLALEGYLQEIEQRASFLRASRTAKAIERKALPMERWKISIIRLKRAIKKAGGEINIDADELELIEKSYRQAEEVRRGSFSRKQVVRRLKEIHSEMGDFAQPEKRRTAVREITNMFFNHMEETQGQDKNSLMGQRRFLAVALTQLAGRESDAETREAVLSALQSVVDVRGAEDYRENEEMDDSMRLRVDRLISQMTENRETERTVSHPETDLADMSVPALVYASEYLVRPDISLDAKRAITKALALSENPILYDVFIDIIRNSEDEKLTRFAVRGVERIIENVNIAR